MSITDQQKMIVTESFNKIVPKADNVAEAFYNRLFVIAPETQILFADTDMRAQGRKLMQTISTSVAALYRLDEFVPDVQDLGRRHIAYGVKKEHYTVVGEALIWALEQSLGDDFTPEVKEAWTQIYTVLASVATSAYDTNSGK